MGAAGHPLRDFDGSRPDSRSLSQGGSLAPVSSVQSIVREHGQDRIAARSAAQAVLETAPASRLFRYHE